MGVWSSRCLVSERASVAVPAKREPNFMQVPFSVVAANYDRAMPARRVSRAPYELEFKFVGDSLLIVFRNSRGLESVMVPRCARRVTVGDVSFWSSSDTYDFYLYFTTPDGDRVETCFESRNELEMCEVHRLVTSAVFDFVVSDAVRVAEAVEAAEGVKVAVVST